MATKVEVFVGDIVGPAVGADAVLNASNSSVALGSGVSAAIAAACGGQAYQRELYRRRDEEFGESLEAGDCLSTGPGTATAFRWVLHVPAVDYRGADPETGGSTGPRRVRACVQSFLAAAEQLASEHGLEGRFAVASALLGAGAGGLGVAASAEAMASALRDYLAARGEACALARVVFVALGAADRQTVLAALARHGLEVA